MLITPIFENGQRRKSEACPQDDEAEVGAPPSLVFLQNQTNREIAAGCAADHFLGSRGGRCCPDLETPIRVEPGAADEMAGGGAAGFAFGSGRSCGLLLLYKPLPDRPAVTPEDPRPEIPHLMLYGSCTSGGHFLSYGVFEALSIKALSFPLQIGMIPLNYRTDAD